MKNKFVLCFALFFLLFAFDGNQNFAFSESGENNQEKERVVYKIKTGKKYHRDGCRYLKKSKIQTTLKQAQKEGLGACKVCKP